jgi:Holliday junction resolvase YEN1
MAKACEKYFEWGTKEIVGKKFASESVGIFSGQVINEAREAVRRMTPAPVLHRDSVPVTGSGPSESASGSSRITSFFQQSTSTAASKTTTTPLEPHKTPAHILRIHSVRKDPTATDLNEYRISYQHEGYLSRCHGAMAGTRCDPSELPAEEREALGLVDRGEDHAGLAASQVPVPGAAKSELRVWVAEYLVREAWPELVVAYEEELRAKADRLKSPRKTRRAAGGGRAAEDTDRFKSFFTQKQGARASRSPSPEEAVEELEDRPPRFSSTIPTSSVRSASGKSSSPAAPKQGKTPRARPRHSSSLPSSELSQTLSVPPGRELDVSPSPTPVIRRTRPRRKSARVTSTSPAPSSPANPALPTSGIAPAPKRTTITTPAAPPPGDTAPGPSKANVAQYQKGKKDEPIDLCSTDDEALPPLPRRSPRNAARSSSTIGRTASTTSSVLAGSSRANEQISSSPPYNRHTSTKKNTTKTKATSRNVNSAKQADDAQTGTLQTLLGLPVVSRGTAVASSPAVNGGQVGELGKLGKTKKKGRVSYVVTYENSDWEEIDSTRGR